MLAPDILKQVLQNRVLNAQTEETLGSILSSTPDISELARAAREALQSGNLREAFLKSLEIEKHSTNDPEIQKAITLIDIIYFVNLPRRPEALKQYLSEAPRTGLHPSIPVAEALLTCLENIYDYTCLEKKVLPAIPKNIGDLAEYLSSYAQLFFIENTKAAETAETIEKLRDAIEKKDLKKLREIAENTAKEILNIIAKQTNIDIYKYIASLALEKEDWDTLRWALNNIDDNTAKAMFYFAWAVKLYEKERYVDTIKTLEELQDEAYIDAKNKGLINGTPADIRRAVVIALLNKHLGGKEKPTAKEVLEALGKVLEDLKETKSFSKLTPEDLYRLLFPEEAEAMSELGDLYTALTEGWDGERMIEALMKTISKLGSVEKVDKRLREIGVKNGVIDIEAYYLFEKPEASLTRALEHVEKRPDLPLSKILREVFNTARTVYNSGTAAVENAAKAINRAPEDLRRNLWILMLNYIYTMEGPKNAEQLEKYGSALAAIGAAANIKELEERGSVIATVAPLLGTLGDPEAAYKELNRYLSSDKLREALEKYLSYIGGTLKDFIIGVEVSYVLHLLKNAKDWEDVVEILSKFEHTIPPTLYETYSTAYAIHKLLVLGRSGIKNLEEAEKIIDKAPKELQATMLGAYLHMIRGLVTVDDLPKIVALSKKYGLDEGVLLGDLFQKTSGDELKKNLMDEIMEEMKKAVETSISSGDIAKISEVTDKYREILERIEYEGEAGGTKTKLKLSEAPEVLSFYISTLKPAAETVKKNVELAADNIPELSRAIAENRATAPAKIDYTATRDAMRKILENRETAIKAMILLSLSGYDEQAKALANTITNQNIIEEILQAHYALALTALGDRGGIEILKKLASEGTPENREAYRYYLSAALIKFLTTPAAIDCAAAELGLTAPASGGPPPGMPGSNKAT